MSARVDPASHVPSGRETAIGRLRWLAVLPAGALAGFLAGSLGGLLSVFPVSVWGVSAESNFVFYLRLLLAYALKEAVFVIAGAMMAPHGRRATSIALALLGALVSLLVHVLRQSNPGVVNYLHVAAEISGALLGAAYFFWINKTRPSGLQPDADR